LIQNNEYLRIDFNNLLLEIMQIKNNFLEPRTIVANRALMNSDDWEIYVKNLLEKFSRYEQKVPSYDFQKIFKDNSSVKKSLNERGIFQMLFGIEFKLSVIIII
jgi:predicted transcriptional regulator YheO